MLLLWLGIVWTAAAFGEEMFFRGYLITRLETALGGSSFAPFLAVIFAAALWIGIQKGAVSGERRGGAAGGGWSRVSLVGDQWRTGCWGERGSVLGRGRERKIWRCWYMSEARDLG
jgi:hypothetical protein